jgi:hypothetical protein
MVFFPRPARPCHTPIRSVIGHAARRGSEAEPVLDERERRRLFQPGSAERFPSAGCCCCGRADGALRAGKAVAERSCGQKPPNGALKGVILFLPNAAALSAPSFACPTTTAVSRAWMKAVEAGLWLISPLEGEMPRTGQRGVARRSQRPMDHPPLSVSPTSPPQGGRSDRARRRAFTNKGMQSHVR